MAQTVVRNVDTQAMERWDDVARTVTTLNQDGSDGAVRAYTAQENALEDSTQAQPAVEAEHAATHERVKTIIDDLKVEKDRAQAVIDKPNNQITAADTKDVARAVKRVADAAIDLAKYVDGR